MFDYAVSLDCYVHDVTDAKDGPSVGKTEFMLQTSTGSAITDVSVLKAALKKGNVVIRVL